MITTTERDEMTFDFDAFRQDVETVEDHQIRELRQILRDEETRRAALPYVAEREDEIAREYQDAHPPEVDEATGLPIWKMPSGAHDAWPIGAVVIYEGQQWRNIHPAPNAWEPNTIHGQWEQLTFPEPESDAPEHPAWVAPSGAHDVYPPGAIVEYEGVLWRNVHTSGNSWSPGPAQHMWEKID